MMRNAQLIKARIIWSTNPMAVVPVLAVTRQGGQTLCMFAKQPNGQFVASGNTCDAWRHGGERLFHHLRLKAGDQVMISSTQFLVNEMPVLPLAPKARTRKRTLPGEAGW